MFIVPIPAAFVICVSAVALSGCISGPPKPADELKSWFDVQREYAAVLDEQFGRNSVYRVAPVIGPVYKIGSPLRPGTPSLITEYCSIEQKLPQQEMGQLPLLKSSKTFGLGLSMPDTIQNVLKGVAEVGVKINVSDTMELNYTNLKHESLSEEGIRQVLKNPKCHDAVRDRNIVLVRGYISGGLKAVSDNTVEIDTKVKFTKVGGFDVKYLDKGGFSIEDKKLSPRFIVITEIQTAMRTKPDVKSEPKPASSGRSGGSARYKILTTKDRPMGAEKKGSNEPTKSGGGGSGSGKADEIVINFSRPTDGTVKALFFEDPAQRKK